MVLYFIVAVALIVWSQNLLLLAQTITTKKNLLVSPPRLLLSKLRHQHSPVITDCLATDKVCQTLYANVDGALADIILHQAKL